MVHHPDTPPMLAASVMCVKLMHGRNVITPLGPFPAISHCLMLIPEISWFCLFYWHCRYRRWQPLWENTEYTCIWFYFHRLLLKCREFLRETVVWGLHWLTEESNSNFLTLSKTAKFCFSCNAIMKKNDLSNFQTLVGFSAFRSSFVLLYLLFNPSCSISCSWNFMLFHWFTSECQMEDHKTVVRFCMFLVNSSPVP